MIWVISLISFALPTYLIRFKIFGIPTTVLELLIYLGILIQIIIIFRSKEMNLKPSNIFIAIAVFLLAGVISTIISPDKRTSLGILKGWLVDPILIFILIILNVKSKEDFAKIIYGLVIGASFVSIWGIFQIFGFSYLLPHQRTDPSFLSYLATGRAFGPFESPNYLGMYLAPITSLTIGYWLKSKTLNPKFETNSKFQILNYKQIFLLFSIIISLLALLFTKSLGAWFGFGVAATFLIWYFIPKDKRVYFWLIISALFITGILLAERFGVDRIRSSFANRVEVWQVSWYLIKKHPILGIGLGMFPKIYTQAISFVHFPPINWGQMHPHNIFLAFWLNTGILGLISFLWILYWFFKTAFKLLSSKLYPLSSVFVAAMLAILVHGLIDTTYWKNDLSLIFWALFGLVYARENFE